jgi:transketolase
MTTDDTPFEIGRAETFWQAKSPRVGIISTGALTYQCLLATEELQKTGVEVEVMNLSTIKPLDKKAVIALAKKAGKIITVEEHQKAGGMGSAVAECLAENFPVPMRIIGINDEFGQSGTPDELIKHYGLEKASIKAVVSELLAK